MTTADAITFRTPEAREAGDFARLHIACWQEAYGAIVPKAILDAADPVRHTVNWQFYLANDTRFVLGAFVGGAAAGFINAGPPVEDLQVEADGHVAALYVLARFQRRGLGRRLLGSAARWWLAQGGQALALGALAENLPARGFYESMGAETMRHGTYLWHGFELPDVIYRFSDLRALAVHAAEASD